MLLQLFSNWVKHPLVKGHSSTIFKTFPPYSRTFANMTLKCKISAKIVIFITPCVDSQAPKGRTKVDIQWWCLKSLYDFYVIQMKVKQHIHLAGVFNPLPAVGEVPPILTYNYHTRLYQWGVLNAQNLQQNGTSISRSYLMIIWRRNKHDPCLRLMKQSNLTGYHKRTSHGYNAH